jgi:hypothetical protein
LDIQVGAQSISPLSWSIESGALDVARAIITDLLSLRADRQNYYFGASILFARHPDIIKRLVEEAPMLLPPLLEGLIWRSHRPVKGTRRVNYFIKYLLIDEVKLTLKAKEGEFSAALKWLVATGDPQIIAHPMCSMVSDALWTGIVYKLFVISKMWNILSLAVVIMSQSALPKTMGRETTDEERDMFYVAILAGRAFTYTLGMGRLMSFHLGRIWFWTRTTLKRIFDEIDQDGSGSIDREEFMEAMGIFKQTIKDEVWKATAFLRDDDGPPMVEDTRKKVSAKSKNLYNIISFILMIVLAVMLSHEPMIWCKDAPNWPTTECPEAESYKYRYSLLSCASMVIHWVILVDLAVFSTELSAFLLVCGHVMGEVKTFLTALTFLLITFGSSIPIFCTECPEVAGNFSSVPRAIVSLFAITIGAFEADDVMNVKASDPVLLIVLFVFSGLSVILLLNLLIAQINRSYEYIAKDMVGFARLNRASLIVGAMQTVSNSKWEKFKDTMQFDKKLEFDAGDIGLAGGIQVTEPQSVHNVLEEQIKRFGGSTSLDTPWPEDTKKADQDDLDDRWDNLEQLLKKSLKRVGTGGGSKSGTGTATMQRSGGGTGTGSGGSEFEGSNGPGED